MAALPFQHIATNTAIDLRTRVRTRTNGIDLALRFMLVFGIAAVAAALTFGLVGQCLLEKTRLEAGTAKVRTVAAANQVESAQSQIRAATISKSVEKWARAQGFVAPDTALPTSGTGEGTRGLLVLNR